MKFSDLQTATILAALRHYSVLVANNHVTSYLRDIATDGGRFPALSLRSIDLLAQKIDGAPEAPEAEKPEAPALRESHAELLAMVKELRDAAYNTPVLDSSLDWTKLLMKTEILTANAEKL